MALDDGLVLGKNYGASLGQSCAAALLMVIFKLFLHRDNGILPDKFTLFSIVLWEWDYVFVN